MAHHRPNQTLRVHVFFQQDLGTGTIAAAAKMFPVPGDGGLLASAACTSIFWFLSFVQASWLGCTVFFSSKYSPWTSPWLFDLPSVST